LIQFKQLIYRISIKGGHIFNRNRIALKIKIVKI